MHQNVSLGSNGVDRVHSLRKIRTQLCGTNFCTSSGRFAPSVGRQPNGLKSRLYETHRNVNLGSNVVDRVLSLPIIPTRLCARTFALVRPVLHRVSEGKQTVPN